MFDWSTRVGLGQRVLGPSFSISCFVDCPLFVFNHFKTLFLSLNNITKEILKLVNEISYGLKVTHYVIKWTFRVNLNESSLYYSRIVMAFLRGISLDVIICYVLRTYQLDCFDRL